MNKIKTIGILVTTLVLAVVAVVTAIYLYVQNQPVAPTAPISKPSAAGEFQACHALSFNISGRAPSPQPVQPPTISPAPIVQGLKIASVSPTSAQPGDTITISGSGFHASNAQSLAVRLNSESGVITLIYKPAPSSSDFPVSSNNLLTWNDSTVSFKLDNISPHSGTITILVDSASDTWAGTFTILAAQTVVPTSPAPVVSPSSAPVSGGTTTSPANTSTALSPAAPPQCNSSTPGSVPVITSAIGGQNSITLKWTRANDPVTHYYVVYGRSTGNIEYSATNIGNATTTSYTVQALSGGTKYYFRIAAVNGCMPGNYSNEVATTATGGTLAGPATGFTAVAQPSQKLPVAGFSLPAIAGAGAGVAAMILGILLAL